MLEREQVLERAQVPERAQVLERAQVPERAQVLERVQVPERAQVLEQAQVLEPVQVLERAQEPMRGRARGAVFTQPPRTWAFDLGHSTLLPMMLGIRRIRGRKS